MMSLCLFAARDVTTLPHKPVGNHPTTLGTLSLLITVKKQAERGALYNGDATLQAQAADLFKGLNQAGSIVPWTGKRWVVGPAYRAGHGPQRFCRTGPTLA